MTLCARCGMEVANGLCPHHVNELGSSSWALTNRIMCDWFHRGKPLPPRLADVEREEFFWRGPRRNT